jgi:hypothetical protein
MFALSAVLLRNSFSRLSVANISVASDVGLLEEDLFFLTVVGNE